MSIQIINVSKKFGDFSALKNISFEVAGGELIALLGPSGSGKTTLLRVIAGLEIADEGQILLDGRDVAAEGISNRKVGFVFQHYSLFRHMSVFDNVAFGLEVRPRNQRPSRSVIRKKVLELLKLVRLDGLARRRPSQLSGGQRQRVALARALAIEPQMLLLDEPFGALDAKVRKELRQWLRELHDKLKMTSIFVTHDQEEALELADRIVVMNEGRIEQIGTPDEVYHHPASPFVYGFLGNVNLFHCRLENGKVQWGDQPVLPDGKGDSGPGKLTRAYVRPHLLEIDRTARPGSLGARIKLIHAAGPTVRVDLMSESGTSIQVELSQEKYRALNLKKDDQVFVIPREMKIFDDYAI